MTEIYDLVGVGFGPSNLSVAVSLAESEHPVRVRFFDRKPAFSWHSGLMFEGSEMQVSFLKDLVTMRNPNSEYSFLSYLQAQGRLAHFINLRNFYPTRVEFNDYYTWVADQFGDQVEFDTEIVSVTGDYGADGTVDSLAVTVLNRATGDERTVRARNLVIAPGGEPVVPGDVRLGERVFHASETLDRLNAHFDDRAAPYHFNIVGAGQTAADVFTYLVRTYPDARITTSMRGFAMRPEDDTHFVNEFFLPDKPEWFYNLPDKHRARVLGDYRSVAHSGVSFDLLSQMYGSYYTDLVSGRQALRIDRFVELVAAADEDHAARAVYRHLHTGEQVEVEADAVILCTGYRYVMLLPMLAGVQEHLEMKSPDQYALERHYSIARRDGFRPGIYLQGYGELTHGFSEVLLSLMPHRAAEITADVAAGLTREAVL